ncbi:MAG TPA: rod-binding protein [Deltaproteobacteria bacterium]|nr:rod-binding protein [Deltaproteobacteria bacterium]
MIDDVAMIARLNQVDRAQALHRACAEFETLFAHQLLKTMAETIPEGYMDGGLASDIYRDMFYFEVARNIGRRGALGIAEALERTMRQRMENTCGSVDVNVEDADTCSEAAKAAEGDES